MKTHFSFIFGILFGIVLLSGFSSELSATPPQKGAVTAALIRSFSGNTPESIQKNREFSETPNVSVHSANVIPASASACNILQTSGEVPVGTESSMVSAIPADSENLMDSMNSTDSDPFLSASESTPMEITDEIPSQMVLNDASTENSVNSINSSTMVVETPMVSTESELMLNPTKDSFTKGTEQKSDLTQAESVSMEIPATQTVENLAVLDETPEKELIQNQNSAQNTDQTPVQPTVSTPVQIEIPAQIPAYVSSQTPNATSSVPETPVSNQESISSTSSGLKPAVPSVDSSSQGVIQGTGKPGETELEGVQVTRLAIEKMAPEEIQVGLASIWTITVKNEGKTNAYGVQIHDSIPQGTQLVNTYPTAQVKENGEITWNVGNMPSGTMASVKMELMPTREGEIGSIASVTTRSETSAKSVATRPQLKVETFGDAEVLLGNSTELCIEVSNPGTGITRNIILSETVPTELQFEGGAELRYEVGDLNPGESKTVKLPLTAVRPGKFQNTITAKAAANLQTESVLAMEVTAPVLELKLQGPSKRFLEKEGTFKLVLSNTGTAPAKNIEMKTSVPNGWKFISANNFGAFLAEKGFALWKLEELGAGETAEAEVVLSPTEIGNFTLNYDASADTCQAVSGTKALSVEGIAALMFQVVDSNDPIQVGEDSKYTIEVVNQGSKQAEDVQVVVEVPAGLQVVSSEEAARSMDLANGRQLSFTPIPTLAPKASKIYRFTVRGVKSGDQRIAVKLSSQEFPTPIVKEESTRVFTE